MQKLETLTEELKKQFGDQLLSCEIAYDQVNIEINPDVISEVALILRDAAPFEFDMLIDVCGVDYLHYGKSEWATESTSAAGFSRAAERGDDQEQVVPWDKPRFAAVYHLLSISKNQRLCIHCFIESEPPMIDSVATIWNAANWFEREAFDLYGILFNGHPDLRRILTDYGFVGHPFRKDFPVSGHVEMRYDARQQRVVYEPVDIQPRVLVPKVIRSDNRYLSTEESSNG